MRNIIAVFILALCPHLLWAQAAPAASSGNRASRFFRAIGREAKASVTDMKRDKLWAATVAGTFALEWMAEGQTAYGVKNGLRESNAFIYGRRPSTARIILLGNLLTVANVMAVHGIGTLFLDSCRREAADPNSRWNSGKIDAATYDPETCRYARSALLGIEWGRRIPDVLGNFNELNQPRVPPNSPSLQILAKRGQH